jgi:hypothetical protein
VVGLEPVESFLQGARELAKDGIVAMASLWVPFGRPVMGSAKAPGLEYYQRVKHGLAAIYQEFGIVPPGERGSTSAYARTSVCTRRSRSISWRPA